MKKLILVLAGLVSGSLFTSHVFCMKRALGHSKRALVPSSMKVRNLVPYIAKPTKIISQPPPTLHYVIRPSTSHVKTSYPTNATNRKFYTSGPTHFESEKKVRNEVIIDDVSYVFACKDKNNEAYRDFFFKIIHFYSDNLSTPEICLKSLNQAVSFAIFLESFRHIVNVFDQITHESPSDDGTGFITKLSTFLGYDERRITAFHRFIKDLRSYESSACNDKNSFSLLKLALKSFCFIHRHERTFELNESSFVMFLIASHCIEEHCRGRLGL